MLFHGTSACNAMGIIEGGYKPSTKGSFGAGVYLTSSSTVAASFSTRKTTFSNNENETKFKVLDGSSNISVFVNEILESEKLNVVGRSQSYSRRTAPRSSHFTKYSGQRQKAINETYETDSRGRRIRTSRSVISDVINHYVCHEDFVIPRYFVQLTERRNHLKKRR